MFLVTRKRFNDLEAKFRNVVSHATGGATADITRSLNDISVGISRHRNDVFAAGALASLSIPERKVLDAMSSEIGHKLANIAADTGLKEADVRSIVQVFVHRGLAEFGHLTDLDGTNLRGRGYTLTEPAGSDFQARLREFAK